MLVFFLIFLCTLQAIQPWFLTSVTWVHPSWKTQSLRNFSLFRFCMSVASWSSMLILFPWSCFALETLFQNTNGIFGFSVWSFKSLLSVYSHLAVLLLEWGHICFTFPPQARLRRAPANYFQFPFLWMICMNFALVLVEIMLASISSSFLYFPNLNSETHHLNLDFLRKISWLIHYYILMPPNATNAWKSYISILKMYLQVRLM